MNQSRYLSEVPRYATNKRFDKELGMWTYDVPARKLWDTPLPETMMLIARNVSEHELNDPDVINELWDELNKGITDSGGVQLSEIKQQSFYDDVSRKHHYDFWITLKTKGGWHV